MNLIKESFKKIYIFLTSIGLDPLKIINLSYIYKYLKHLWVYKKRGGVIHAYFPILCDFHQNAGNLPRDYFLQDLHVANLIFKASPRRHLDIGSRLDGFIAHIASFRKIEVMDIRPLRNEIHENITFVQANLMQKNPNLSCSYDSISCLHAIEHFGLGRYNDPINPQGYKDGFNNLLDMLEIGGKLYISFPIASKNQVQFNAQRVFHPLDILSWADSRYELKLDQFDYIDNKQFLHLKADPISTLNKPSGCGIFTFIKTN